VNDDEVNRVVASLKGKTINQLIAEGNSKLGGASSSAPAANNNSKPAKEAPKKEEPKKK
jgi:ribosomal protein L12E/L44/L45/RPP1/RPP2